MRSLSLFAVLSLVLAGCYDMHGYVPPVMVMGDAGIVPVGDAGPMMVTPDAGPVTPDSGTVILADAGTDAFVPPMADAGSDAGPPPGFIEAFDMRPSNILVADPSHWQQVASYWVGPDESLASVDVVLNGDAADIEMVAIASDGRVLGTNIFPVGVGSLTSVELVEPLVAPPGERRRMDVWVRISNVMSYAATGGADIGSCNSGDVFSVGVRGIDRYIGAGRFHSDFTTISGNEFVIRKSRPTVTRQALSSTTLSAGLDLDLYKFQVSADSAGPVGLRAIRFRMSVFGSAALSRFGLRRGAVEVPSSDVTVTYDGEYVLVIFTTEQTISGSGYVYLLHALVEGPIVAGDSVSFEFARNVTDNTALTGSVGPAGQLDTLHGWAAGMFHTGILWSDMSEVPHTDTTWSSSLDWTGDRFIEDLTQTSTLSR